jgi:hypothetical protein
MTVLFAASWDCDSVGEQVFGDRSVSAEAVDVEDADFVGDMVIGGERRVGWYSDGKFPVSLREGLVVPFGVDGRGVRL